MDKSLDNHRKELIRQALELWDYKGDLKDIEKDPVVKLLFSALAYQSHSITQEIGAFQEMTINEFRNKMIPFYLIKPFPAYSVVETKIPEATNPKAEPILTFKVDESCTFDFENTKIPFAPLFNTTILNAAVTDRKIRQNSNAIELTLTSKNVIDNFAGASIYVDGAGDHSDVEVLLNNRPLPLIKPDDYDNLPFTDWFQNHHLIAEENQLQYGCYDYWVELYVKNQIQMFYIDEYNTSRITNRSLTPTLSVRFKNTSKKFDLEECKVKINCVPIVNVQKNTVYLSDNEPIKKLSTDESAFLNLLYDGNVGDTTSNYIIRHFGIERYSQKELLFQLNDLFNRFISDYYAFKDIEELKKGEKLETIYRTFKDLLPVIKKDNDDVHPNVYAILKLDERLSRSHDSVKIDFLTTYGEAANKIKEGEVPTSMSGFLDKNNTVLLKETAGGRNEETNEANLNHLARYNLLTKDKIVTGSDVKAFCFREFNNKIKNVSVTNTGEYVAVTIQFYEEYMPQERQEVAYYEQLIQQKIKVRSLLCVPVQVKLTS